MNEYEYFLRTTSIFSIKNQQFLVLLLFKLCANRKLHMYVVLSMYKLYVALSLSILRYKIFKIIIYILRRFFVSNIEFLTLLVNIIRFIKLKIISKIQRISDFRYKFYFEFIKLLSMFWRSFCRRRTSSNRDKL